MKKYFTLLVTSIFYILPILVNAQGIYQFWGTTSKGGKDFQGSFFSTKFDGTGFTNKPYFTAPYSGKPVEGNKPVAYGGKFYSVLSEGGVNNDGIISEYDPASNLHTTKVNFYDLHTGSASNALVQLGNKLYGVTYGYQPTKPSALYEFDPVTGSDARLQITAAQKQNVNIKLADAMGKIVLQKTIAVSAGVSQLTLTLPNISKGVYYFIYRDEKLQKTFKLVKQ